MHCRLLRQQPRLQRGGEIEGPSPRREVGSVHEALIEQPLEREARLPSPGVLLQASPYLGVLKGRLPSTSAASLACIGAACSGVKINRGCQTVLNS